MFASSPVHGRVLLYPSGSLSCRLQATFDGGGNYCDCCRWPIVEMLCAQDVALNRCLVADVAKLTCTCRWMAVACDGVLLGNHARLHYNIAPLAACLSVVMI